MSLSKTALSAGIITLLLAVIVSLGGPKQAYGDLHWQPARKEVLRVRLIALSLGFPRSSFFSTHEVFIAEKQLERNEGLLVKLVYEFLPYQPRLSDYGLDYTVLHEIRAVRDPACDETLRQMSSPQNVPEWSQPDQSWKYADEAPWLNPKRHRSSLPCYETTADDYGKSVHEPLGHQQF